MVLLMSFAVATLLAQAPASPTEASIAGRVVDGATQAPVSGAQVMLIPDGPRTGPTGTQPPMTQTDRDGRYAFPSVPAGRYRVNIVKAGFTMSADSQRAASVTITAGDQRTDVIVQMQRGGVITGRITDETGEPVTDATVVGLRRPPGSRGDVLLPSGSAQVNDLGEFRLLVPPGEYYVQASMRSIGFGNATSSRSTTVVPTYFPGTRDQLAAQPVVVDSGQTYSDVVIRLIEAPAFRVSGIVRNEDGRPVANALVRLGPEGASARTPYLGGPNMQVRTDSAGRYSISNITAGAYTLTAIAPTVVARTPVPAGSGGITFGSAGIVGGSIGGGVTTETRNGVTIEYRDDYGTRVPITIGDASVDDLAVVVR
jgi:protocatechuate 3,4-dioxygenase beta subunit